MPDLVGLVQDDVHAIEMARLSVEIDRSNGYAAAQMQDVQALHQLDEVLVVGKVSGPTTVVEIAGIGRPANGVEGNMVAAEGHGAIAIAWCQCEFGRRLGDLFLDQATVEAHQAGRKIDIGTRSLQAFECGIGEEFDTQFFQHTHGGVVDRLDLISRDDGRGRIGVTQALPGDLGNGWGNGPSFFALVAASVHALISPFRITRSRRNLTSPGSASWNCRANLCPA